MPSPLLAEEDFHLGADAFHLEAGGGGGGGTSYIIDQILGTATFCSIGGNGLTGRADLNGDGKVNLVDLSILLFHLGKFNVEYDCNSDNKVDFIDISIMFYYWTE